MRQPRLSLFAPSASLLALLALAACDEAGKGPPPAVSATAAAPGSATPSAPAGPAAALAGSATAAPAGSAASLAGTWEGDYVAKKGEVGLPPKVKDKTYEKDDGKALSGKGAVTLVVAGDGEVSGTSQGALGEAVLSGHAEDRAVRASFMPKDPRAPQAMTGVLVGVLKDGAIVGQIRAAGPDGTVVREAPISLRKK